METQMSEHSPSERDTATLDNADKAKLLRQVRQSLSPQIGLEDAPPPMVESVEVLNDDDNEDLLALRHRANIYHVPLMSSHRFGKVLTSVRKLARKILKPILMYQVGYNGANARVAETLNARVAQLREEVDTLQATIRDRDETITQLRSDLDNLATQQKIQAKAIQKLIREQAKLSDRPSA